MDTSIPDPLRAWGEAQVADGHYESADAFVGDLIPSDGNADACPPRHAARAAARVRAGQRSKRPTAGMIRRDRMPLLDRETLVACEDSGISPRRIPDIVADLKWEFDGGRGGSVVA